MFVLLVFLLLFNRILVLLFLVRIQVVCLLFILYYPKSILLIFIRLMIVEILGV